MNSLNSLYEDKSCCPLLYPELVTALDLQVFKTLQVFVISITVPYV